MKVLALGADDPAPDENTVISSEPVSILFVLRYVYIFTSYFHAGLWIWIQIRMDPDPLHFNTTRPTPRRILAAACRTKVRWKKCLAGLASPTFLLLFPTHLSGSVSELGLWSYDFYAGFL